MTAIEKIQLLTNNSNTALISLMVDKAKAEIESYINKEYVETTMENVLVDMVIVKLNRRGAEGISSQSYSGTSESFESEYPAYIIRQLERLKLSGRKRWGLV